MLLRRSLLLTLFADLCTCHDDFQHHPASTHGSRPKSRAQALLVPERLVSPDPILGFVIRKIIISLLFLCAFALRSPIISEMSHNLLNPNRSTARR